MSCKDSDTTVQKLTPTVTAIDVQDDEEVVIVAEDYEVTLTEDEIGNLFQDTSPNDKLGNEWLKTNVRLCKKNFLCRNLQLLYTFKDQANSNFPGKILGINVITIYDTGTMMSCLSYTC